MARSADRRAKIRAEDRIENAMSDLKDEASPEAYDEVRAWLAREYGQPEAPAAEPETGDGGIAQPRPIGKAAGK